ncbi:MAG: hypothetical protein GTO18_20960 [Anaerolineales bacterium]|nr:hypothetical protein [Anaerolineales bacterium]
MNESGHEDDLTYEQVRAVKNAHETDLLKKANVVGVGVGLKQHGGEFASEVVLVVMVERKVPNALLDPQDVIPDEIDGVPVDVQEVGKLNAQ